MKLSEGISEFMIPGIVVVGGLALLFSDTAIGHKALVSNLGSLGTATITILVLASAYIAGVLCSEVGTALVRRRGNRVCRRVVQARFDDLRLTRWGIARDPGRPYDWSVFSYMRAACRAVEGVRNKIESHENVLRVLRSSIVAMPLSVLSVATYAMRNVSWPSWVCWIFVSATVVVAYIGCIAVFAQRLGTAVRSTIEHYLATPSAFENISLAQIDMATEDRENDQT